MYNRIQKLPLSGSNSCFLWGPRQTGKSTLLRILFPKAKRYDLLLSTEYQRLVRQPELIREECQALGLNGETQEWPIIIDEIQKVPQLLDEVHWLIENKGLRFILCGSSARKLKRGHGNLLGGRAIRYNLHPLVYPEIGNFELSRALNSGLLPKHYMSANTGRLLQSYVGDYLKEEIAAEAVTRNMPAFNRFLEIAALSNGEMVNYQNIAQECGISAPAVKGYFQILEDTLIGHFLRAYRKKAKRRLIKAPKFYFFDVGLVSFLTRRGRVSEGSELFGKAFEHYITMEALAHSDYSELFYPVSYWRTASQLEIDLVLGEHEVALEVKSTKQAAKSHLRGLRAFLEEYKPKHAILVSLDPKPRTTDDGIQILPWNVFLDRLWSNELVG